MNRKNFFKSLLGLALIPFVPKEKETIHKLILGKNNSNMSPYFGTMYEKGGVPKRVLMFDHSDQFPTPNNKQMGVVIAINTTTGETKQIDLS